MITSKYFGSEDRTPSQTYELRCSVPHALLNCILPTIIRIISLQKRTDMNVHGSFCFVLITKRSTRKMSDSAYCVEH